MTIRFRTSSTGAHTEVGFDRHYASALTSNIREWFTESRDLGGPRERTDSLKQATYYTEDSGV